MVLSTGHNSRRGNSQLPQWVRRLRWHRGVLVIKRDVVLMPATAGTENMVLVRRGHRGHVVCASLHMTYSEL